MKAILIVVIALVAGGSNSDESDESQARREAPVPVVDKRQTGPAVPCESVPIKRAAGVDGSSANRPGPKPPTALRLTGAKSGAHRPLPPCNLRVVQSSVGQRKRR